ncbi:nucleotidyltransferase family protein [Candidatus Nitronereus thalassa]|uniref:Nucleotidyltransferase family protein n=1 Tax=Candidatus Nitronereus thalassa TaxID=3020898 RepID=A0ABU3K5B9_9BACT|nr:nucleotidyltransferase family protein [Candidatus Nitronereus thalassa]MDT7041590.1 nucleotidyltransferase family protein [Candidatus Nitronereus thalassa]
MITAYAHHNESFLNFLNFVETGNPCFGLRDSSINWMALVDHANTLGIGPIVYYRLKHGSGALAIPEEVLATGKSLLYWNQARNMKRFGSLKEVLTLFAAEGIFSVALKGTALANVVYPHVGLRPMADVDLLVREEDLTKAEQILISLGFEANEREHSKEWYQQHHHHIVPYVSRDKSIVVELHRHLVSERFPTQIPIQDLWERARYVEIAGVPCQMLSPEDLLIHLSLHVAVDSYIGKIKVLYDLEESVKHFGSDIDWKRLDAIAMDYRISKYLYYALWLAKEVVCADVPDVALKKLHSRFCGFPFEERLIKRSIRKAIVLQEQDMSPVCLWMLSMACSDTLSHHARSKKVRNIFRRVIRRYVAFSRQHAKDAGVSMPWYLIVSYPVYLLRKLLGLAGSMATIHPKKF